MEQPTTSTYTDDDLKVSAPAKRKPFNFKQEEETPYVKKDMTTGDYFKTVILLVFGYALISLIPTWLMMQFANANFWVSQGIVVVLLTVIVLAFGLHKEASPEQLAKRDKHKKRP